MATACRERARAGLPLVRRLVPVCALFLAACGDTPPVPADDEPAEFVAMRRAWLPGERAAKIQDIVSNRRYVFPYAGDISDLAPQFFADPDSVTVMVANPAFQPSLTGPEGAGASLTLFSPAWDFVALKLTIVDSTALPVDTVFWHLAVWADPVTGGNHGFAIAASRANTFNIRPISNAAFDASAGTVGAAAGEFHLGTATYWEDDARGGRFRVDAQTYPGAFSTVTSGPFTGGLARVGTAFGRVQKADFVRVSGAENPATFRVDFDYRAAGLPSTEIVCVFPSPCTTNVPLIAAALRSRSGMPVPGVRPGAVQ